MTSPTSSNLRAVYEAPATPPRVRKMDMSRLLMAPNVEYVPRRRIDFDSDAVLADDRHNEVPSIMDTPKKRPDTPPAPYVPMRDPTWAPKRPHASRRLGLANLANNPINASTPTRPVRAVSRQEVLLRAPKADRKAAPRFVSTPPPSLAQTEKE